MPRIDPKKYASTYRSSGYPPKPKAIDYKIKETVPPTAESKDEPLALIYNISDFSLRKGRISQVLRQDLEANPLMDFTFGNPPMLCDGRTYTMDIPRWAREIEFSWRKVDGEGGQSVIKYRTVVFPKRIWYERNFRGMWKVLWIERAGSLAVKPEKDIEDEESQGSPYEEVAVNPVDKAQEEKVETGRPRTWTFG